MEAKVILCDICKRRVGIMKCPLCNRDICGENECMKSVNVIVKHPFKICKICSKSLKNGNILSWNNYFRDSEEFFKDFDIKPIESKFMDYIRVKVLLDKIKNG